VGPIRPGIYVVGEDDDACPAKLVGDEVSGIQPPDEPPPP
jgi:hypothetical protein